MPHCWKYIRSVQIAWADPENSVRDVDFLTTFFVFFSHQLLSQMAVQTSPKMQLDPSVQLHLEGIHTSISKVTNSHLFFPGCPDPLSSTPLDPSNELGGGTFYVGG